MSDVKSYIKQPPVGEFKTWAEREFEAVERGLEDAAYGLRWDDLRFPASTVRVGGTGTATEGTDGTLIFAGNADQVIQGIAQMPHAWKQGSAIRPHIHLQFKTSAALNTRWKLTWDIANVNDDFGVTTGDDTITVANAQNVNKHAIASFAEIDMTGFKWSCVIKWTLTRLASSDAADNDTNAANLIEFDIHYQSDGRGSIPEYPT